MKINKIFASIFAVAALTLSSCEKSFEELEKDPNRPVNVPAALVLQGVEADMFNNTGRPFGAEMRWNQFYCSNYNYYATNEYTWTETPNHFNTLKNVVKMEEEAKLSSVALPLLTRPRVLSLAALPMTLPSGRKSQLEQEK